MKRLLPLGLAAAAGVYFSLRSPAPPLARPEIAQERKAPAASPAPHRKPASVLAKGGIKAELERARACYDTEDCDFPKTDPRSYGIAVGHRIAFLLAELQGSGDPRAAEMAREYMQIDDGFVQEAAMKVFSSAPPSRENVNSMISGLEHSHDPLLVEQAMSEWERYIGSPEEAAIQEFLADFIAHGGQFSSEKASELILKFLNERSYSTFQSALAAMEPNSTPARNLRSALNEYARMQTGG